MAGPLLEMNARERKLLAVLGFIGASLLPLAIPFGIELVVRSAQGEADDLRQALSDVQDARGKMKERQAQKDALAARYAKTTPALAGYLEQMAHTQRLEVTDSTPLTDIPHGKRYVEHGTNIHLKKTGMLALSLFLESLEKSGYPIAVTRLDVRKRSGEPDSYDVEVGVASFERTAAASQGAPAGSAKP
jgi:general secretion pathway protein M